MNENEKKQIYNLRLFAFEKRITASKLGKELGYSRERVTSFFREQYAISEGFKWRFACKYGFDQAAAIFDTGHEAWN